MILADVDDKFPTLVSVDDVPDVSTSLRHRHRRRKGLR